MHKLILLSGGLLACGAIAEPAMSKPRPATTCDTRYYADLVGKDVSETQHVTDPFRVVPQGSNIAASEANRLTFVYEKGSNRIVSISCG